VTALLYILLITLGVLLLLRRLLPAHLKHLISAREIGAATLLPTVATISPSYLLFCLFVVTFMALVPATPEQRLRLLLFCIPLLPSLSWLIQGPGPIQSLFTIHYNLLLMLGCCVVLAGLARSSAAARFRHYDLLVFGLACTLALSEAKEANLTSFMRVLVQTALTIFLPYYLFSRGAAAMRGRPELLLPLLFAAVIIASVATFETQRQWLLYSELNYVHGLGESINPYTKQRGGFLRASTTFPEPTSLSLFIGISAVMCVALRKHLGSRIIVLVMLSLLILGQASTYSRIGWVTIAVGLTGLLIFERRLGLLAALTAAGLGAWLLLSSLASRMPAVAAAFGLSEEAAGSVDYREQLRERAIEELAHQPWFGLSSSEIQVRLDDMRQGEGIIDLVNTPIQIALQSGLIGLFFFYLPSAVVALALLRARKRLSPGGRIMAGTVFAMLLALHVGLITTSFVGRNELWLTTLLAMGAGLLAQTSAYSRKPTNFAQGSDGLAAATA
jgi:hypothetical protein